MQATHRLCGRSKAMKPCPNLAPFLPLFRISCVVLPIAGACAVCGCAHKGGGAVAATAHHGTHPAIPHPHTGAGTQPHGRSGL